MLQSRRSLQLTGSVCGSGILDTPLPKVLSPDFSAIATLNVTRYGGHEIQLNVPAGSIVKEKLGNTTTAFALQSVHFHSPAEHILNGIDYAMESHLVCNNTKTGQPLDSTPNCRRPDSICTMDPEPF